MKAKTAHTEQVSLGLKVESDERKDRKDRKERNGKERKERLYSRSGGTWEKEFGAEEGEGEGQGEGEERRGEEMNDAPKDARVTIGG